MKLEITFRWKYLSIALVAFCLLSAFGYWWTAIRPYYPVEAILAAPLREIRAEENGVLPEALLQEGEAFKLGQLFFASNQDKLNQAKFKLDQNMQQYVYLQNEIGSSEVMDQVLSELQKWQQKVAELEKDRPLVPAAPFDGIVLQCFKTAGEKTHLGEPVLLISKQQNWVEAEIPETMLSKMRVGLSASVKLPSYPGKTWVGKVAWISPLAKHGKLKIRIYADDLPFKPGLTAKASIKIHGS